MAYADKRIKWLVKLGASVADNTNIAGILVPAGKEIEVYGMNAIVRTKSPTASAKVELVDSANAILSSCVVDITVANNAVQAGSATFPFKYINTGTTATFLSLRTDQASGAGCDLDIQVDMQDPGCR